MAITVHLTGALTRLGAPPQVGLSGGTVRDAVVEVGARYPALAPRLHDARNSPHPYIALFVNGANVRLQQGLDTPLAEGDELLIVTAVAGG